MSDGKKPNTKAEQPAEEIEEAVVVPAETEADEASADAKDADTAEPIETPDPEATPEQDAPDDGTPVLEGEALDPDAPDQPETEEQPEQEPDRDEDQTEQAPPPVLPLPPEQVIVNKGGFMPLFLGGVVAAVIGFGLARFVIPDWPAGSTDSAAQIETALAAPRKDIADLSARLAELEGGPDLSGMTGQVDDLRDSLTARIDGMDAQLSELKARVDELASRPNMAGSATEAVAAYEAQMEKLRAEVAAMTEDARAQKAEAEMTEREAMLRNSLTRVRIALDEGTPFPDELANIEAAGINVPDGLSAIAQSGAPTLSQLQEDFPDAARRALSASRKGSDGSSTVGSVMNRILGTRSLAPREGNDPDAVLSRAEAALKEARLTDALAEIDALPDAAKAELADWTAGATQRTAALAAADALGQELNKD